MSGALRRTSWTPSRKPARTPYDPAPVGTCQFTRRHRQFAVSRWSRREGDYPLHTNSAFATTSLGDLRRIADADMLTEVTVLESGVVMAMMREVRFLSVVIHPEGATVIESGQRF